MFFRRLLAIIPVLLLGSDQPAFAAEPSRPLDYALVITGEELLRGAFADTHTAFITRTLLPMGGHCVLSMLVDDRIEDLKAGLRFATARAPLVIVTGGLGPTVNDVTRMAVSEFTGIPLTEKAEVIATLERRYGQTREGMRANLRRQALVPRRGGHLDNAQGSAVGLIFDDATNVIVALPGPPRELQPMVLDQLRPFLAKRFGARPHGASLTLRFVGLGQSQIDQTMSERISLPPGTVVGSVFEGSRVDFIFSLPGDADADRAALKELAAAMRRQFGASIYAEDDSTLEQVAARALARRGGKLLLGEVATQGTLATAFLRRDESAQCLAAAHSAPSERQLAASLGVKASGTNALPELARAAAQLCDARAAVIVGEPAVEGNGRTAAVCFVLPDGRVESLRLPVGRGENATAALATQVLDRFRRTVE